MIIKEIALEQRPRERLLSSGADSLSDAELLALVLQNGSFGENVIDMSHKLISKFGLGKLNSLPLQELMKINGIGIAKASKLVACFELCKRVKAGNLSGKIINNPSDVAGHYMEKLRGLKKEHFIAVFLDTKNRIIRDKVVSVGTLNSSLVHPREIFREAITHSANSIILVHNHPSGDPSPSEEDSDITEALKTVGNLCDIKVLDHVIVGESDYFSFES